MKMLVNGIWTDAILGKFIDVFNPATNVIIDTVPRATKEDVEKAVTYAKIGYKINRATPVYKRAEYLSRTSDLILEHVDDLVELMIAENGKSFYWADYEIRKTAEIFQNFADRCKDPQGETYPMDSMVGCSGQMAMVYRQSRGVVGAIIPFNFPMEMLGYKVAGSLAAGNSVVVKLSGDCPLTCLRTGQLMLEAGVPKEIFHFLPGHGNEAGDALVVHPDVPVITFTGSSSVGANIMERSGKYLKHLSLELGGNDPVIVFEDADLDSVANNLVKGRMTVGNGQACVADKRFIVHRSIEKELLDKCKAVVEKLKIGDPSDHSVDVGPVIHAKSASNIEAMINDAINKGAHIITGGKRIGETFIQPTILADVTEEMDVFSKECFGPVAPFTIFDTEQQAINLANNSQYGLQGAVYSRDISRAMRVADEMEVGGVVINASSCFRPGNVPYMPRKMSGIGTDNMYNCYEEMTTGKAIVINDAIGRLIGK